MKVTSKTKQGTGNAGMQTCNVEQGTDFEGPRELLEPIASKCLCRMCIPNESKNADCNYRTVAAGSDGAMFQCSEPEKDKMIKTDNMKAYKVLITFVFL